MIPFLEIMFILTVDMESHGKKKVVMGWRGSAGTMIVGNIERHTPNTKYSDCAYYLCGKLPTISFELHKEEERKTKQRDEERKPKQREESGHGEGGEGGGAGGSSSN